MDSKKLETEQATAKIVRIKKMSNAPGGIDPGDATRYVNGAVNKDVSLPVDYTLEGNEIEQPQIGKQYSVMRTKRNGVHMPGMFVSTAVLSIEESVNPITGARRLRVCTANSAYQVEYE